MFVPESKDFDLHQVNVADTVCGTASTQEAAAATVPYRRLRAPSASNSTLTLPSVSKALSQIQSGLFSDPSDNRSPSDDLSDDGFWRELRQLARQQLISDAARYTRRYRDVELPDGLTSELPILMAGHQPELFHPGVWLKNRTLDHMAAACRGIAVNLVIDNDVAGSRSVRLPSKDTVGHLHCQSVPFDRGGSGVPYEQAEIQDRELFHHFDRRVAEAVRPWVGDPLVHQLWPHARDAIARCGIAGCALAQARHALEGQLGWQTLEIPLGVAVRGLPFAKFVERILQDLPHFVEVYNASADHYRGWHGIRSSAHPVPNLHREGEWLETPLWVYGNRSPHRRALWARRDKDGWLLSDRVERSVTLPAATTAETLVEAASPEFKVRPRALMTTMFARLVLSDWFIHGIGGGKYDQLADQVIRGFFRRTPPPFQVVSGTFRLPQVDDDIAKTLDRRSNRFKRLIRESFFQAERHLDQSDPKHREWCEKKQQLLTAIPPKGQRWQWHREMTAVNEQLSRFMAGQRRRWQADLAETNRQLQDQQVIASRELPFCVFPLEDLQTRFAKILA